jgi:hypothetical protein
MGIANRLDTTAQECPMPPHKFAIGQDVPPGTYTITRTLPGDDLDRTYRARSARDGHERVFREQQISAA